jgi:hypothetical protein
LVYDEVVVKYTNKIKDDLTLIEVNHNGKNLRFLNGVLQMPANNRFITARSPQSGDHMLIIEDYAWWTVNANDIEQWMRDHLPRGTNHQQGMILNFDNEEQRTWFMLRWQ